MGQQSNLHCSAERGEGPHGVFRMHGGRAGRTGGMCAQDDALVHVWMGNREVVCMRVHSCVHLQVCLELCVHMHDPSGMPVAL